MVWKLFTFALRCVYLFLHTALFVIVKPYLNSKLKTSSYHYNGCSSFSSESRGGIVVFVELVCEKMVFRKKLIGGVKNLFEKRCNNGAIRNSVRESHFVYFPDKKTASVKGKMDWCHKFLFVF